jgi:hypothetical protein
MSAYLRALVDELQDFEALFLSPDDLERLDVQAVPVSLGSGNELSFNPCYFRPHPDGLFKKYPPLQDEDEDEDVVYMQHFPTLQEIIDRDPSNAINPILAKMESGHQLGCFPEWIELDDFDGDFELTRGLRPDIHNSELSNMIGYHLNDLREGSDGEDVILSNIIMETQELWR